VTDAQATALVDLIDELIQERALAAVFQHDGDYDGPSSHREIKAKLVTLLRELP